MEYSELRFKNHICSRCGNTFKLSSNISNKILSVNFEKLTTLCRECRDYKICKNENCKIEFKHHQNQTCSKKCASELKKQSYTQSTGKEHNFCRNSSSRNKFEKRLKDEFGVINQFQRSDVKDKLKSTWLEKYGVDNPSKSIEIQAKKKITLANTLKNNPNLYKINWKSAHIKFLDTLGYDPRLTKLSQTSKESINYFLPLIDKLDNLNIKYYIGIEGNREFCIRDIEFDRSYFYDLVIPSLNQIIEYNGVAWHAKNGQYDFIHPISKQTYLDNFKSFNRKIEVAKNKGFAVMIIWSDDLDKHDKLENLINKIYENSKNN